MGSPIVRRLRLRSRQAVKPLAEIVAADLKLVET